MHHTGMDTAELNRRLENLLRLGLIIKVDHAARKVQVQTGELKPWLNWPAEIGRNYKRWRPLREGTQVLLGSISGDTAQAHIIGVLYTDTLASPSTDENIDLIQFDDGSYIKHHAGEKSLSIHSAADLNLTAVGTIKINGQRVDIN